MMVLTLRNRLHIMYYVHLILETDRGFKIYLEIQNDDINCKVRDLLFFQFSLKLVASGLKISFESKDIRLHCLLLVPKEYLSVE